MITSILQQIEFAVQQPENLIFDPENYSSYIGDIIYSKRAFVFETDTRFTLGSKDWDAFLEVSHMLEINPLGRKGMVPNWEDNKLFLEKELAVWTRETELDPENAPWMAYSSMWDGIPNVSECAYGKLMSVKYLELQKKLKSYTDTTKLPKERTAINRTFVVNFPDASFCPIGLSFNFTYDLEEDVVFIELMMNFRSLEVSRNIKNDMYLFLGFIRSLLMSVTEEGTVFEVRRFVLTAQDAHIIEI